MSFLRWSALGGKSLTALFVGVAGEKNSLEVRKVNGRRGGNGYTPELAATTFKQPEGFGSYGFPESHAASFALIAYASSWMKCHHPDVFCAALLNSQPMGFYLPAQIVRDAQAHGVDVRPVCVNASRWDCTLEAIDEEGRFAVRLGLRLVKGLANADAAAIITARTDDPFASIDDLWQRAGVPAASLVQLAEADAFRPDLGLARREALWALKGVRKRREKTAQLERDEGRQRRYFDSQPPFSRTRHVTSIASCGRRESSVLADPVYEKPEP